MAYYDHDRRSYHHHHHGRERDEEPYHYHNHKRRRFDKYRVIGLLLMFFGISILTLGVFDIGWTTSRYGSSCQPDYSGVYNNLCSGNHVYVYVAAPLWGGALLIIVALLSLAIHPDKQHHYNAHRRFLILLGINLIIVLPAIIVLNVLEVYYGKNIFWMFDANGSLVEYDALQFALPITIIILAGLAFNVVLFFSVFMYCCGDTTSSQTRNHHANYDRDAADGYRGRHWSHDPYRHQHDYDRNRGRYFYR